MKRVLSLIALAVLSASPEISQAQAQVENCSPPVPEQPSTLEGAASDVYKHAGRDLRIHAFSPEQRQDAAPAILFFFGGGWRTGSITALERQARAFAQQGYVALLADYRVQCRDQTTPVDSLADAQSAYDWLRAHDKELRIDNKRITLSGSSAGGHLALTVAMHAPADRRPAALVLFNPVVNVMSFERRYNLSPDAVRRISPSALPTKELPPTIIFHGIADKAVSIDTVRIFCGRATADGRVCDLQEYADHGHSFFHSNEVDARISASPYDDTVAKSLAFVKRHVPGR